MLVVLTVDVEPSVAGAFSDPLSNTPLMHEPVWGEVGGRSEALGFLLRTLARYDLKATFFVETAHVHTFPQADMGGYVEKLLQAGQDIQLHLHPVWTNFPLGFSRPENIISDCCDRIPQDHLCSLIDQGLEQLRGWGVPKPTSMRTGNFSVSRNIYEAMRGAGLSYSSSICVGVNRYGWPNLPSGAYDIAGIIEIPMTCFEDKGPIGRGRQRPLQVTSCSFAEMRAALKNLHKAGGKIAVILTHPFEFLKKDDFRYTNMRANALVQSRFAKLCAFLAKNEPQFTTVTLAQAAVSLENPYVSPRLEGKAVYSVCRAAQNFLNDRLF